MTETAKAKAAKVLLNRNGVLGEDRYLPIVWVVGEEISLFRNAALRYRYLQHKYYGIIYDIEEFTIQQAYQFLYGRQMPKHFERKIVQGFNQAGELYKGESFDPRISTHIFD